MKTDCQVLAYNKVSNSEHISCKLLATVKENLSALIQRRLKELKISKADLAKKIGVSRTYITDLSNGTGNTQSGQYRPSPEIVTKLSKSLEVSELEILNAIGYSPKSNSEDSHEILEGVTVQFDRSVKLSTEEKENILEAMRLVAAGVKARKENQ